jgi:hypothetical protein
MARFWTCPKCRTRNARTRQRCDCGRKRPAPRRPKHAEVLDRPYEWWVETFGDKCGICGRGPSELRRLDRDHDHRTGAPRGLLCHFCNRRLGNRRSSEWLRAAADYIDRALDVRV